MTYLFVRSEDADAVCQFNSSVEIRRLELFPYIIGVQARDPYTVLYFNKGQRLQVETLPLVPDGVV